MKINGEKILSWILAIMFMGIIAWLMLPLWAKKILIKTLEEQKLWI